MTCLEKLFFEYSQNRPFPNGGKVALKHKTLMAVARLQRLSPKEMEERIRNRGIHKEFEYWQAKSGK